MKATSPALPADVAEFPAQQARTRRFTLGIPRDFCISRDGSRIAFLRSMRGDDPVTCLWAYDVAAKEERLLADPRTLVAQPHALPAEERARRERAREAAAGIVRFAADDALSVIVFELDGGLHVLSVDTGVVRRLESQGAALDVRIDPTGTRIAYVSGGALHVIGCDGADDRCLIAPEAEDVSYGLAEFIAAEEMGRQDGYWWSPDGARLLVERVDTSSVQQRFLSDPADPTRPPVAVRYPAAGTANAAVSLSILDLDSRRVEVDWDSTTFEYFVTAHWSERALLIVVQTRDQRRMQLLSVDPLTGASSLVREDTDQAWVDIWPGVPEELDDGTLVWIADSDGATRLVIGEHAVTGDELMVRQVLGVDGDTVLFTASTEPTEIDLWTWDRGNGVRRFAAGPPGVLSAKRRGGTSVVVNRTLATPETTVTVHRDLTRVGRIDSRAEKPLLHLNLQILELGQRRLRTALLFPAGHAPGNKLPVLVDPYGGPAAQRVLAAYGAHLESQWFAEQGFAVIVIDGRGTPGRGPAWSRAILDNRADPVLEDQVDGLMAAAQRFPDLDLRRVGIRGWSYGGFLAALAVLRRPDVFHAAVAGAPVTDQRLYDTHYTERYLGHPAEHREGYERMSLLTLAPRLERPLMLVHGIADDNVYVANTLQLSSALTAAARPHTLLLLSEVTHSPNRADVSTSLLMLELDFLRQALGLPQRSGVTIRDTENGQP